jgi:hypothetical protein
MRDHDEQRKRRSQNAIAIYFFMQKIGFFYADTKLQTNSEIGAKNIANCYA